ncbi:MAG: glycosyltransferase family 2 protein, partial [Microgenomates group bacterium]
FWLLKKIGFWDVNIIPEDWHIFFQAFFTFGDKVKTVPLYTIVNGDAVYSGALLKTFVNRYEQEKRWAWGVSDIGYVLKRSFETPQINFFSKLKKIIFISETHLFWPVSFFILTLSASIPPLVNPIFKQTVMGFLLPKLS